MCMMCDPLFRGRSRCNFFKYLHLEGNVATDVKYTGIFNNYFIL